MPNPRTAESLHHSRPTLIVQGRPYRLPLLEPPGLAPPDDRGVARLALVARLAALGQHAGRAARVPAAGGAALTAAHRVIDRVHRRAAVVRLAAHVPLAAGLAQRDVHVFGVADRADRP